MAGLGSLLAAVGVCKRRAIEVLEEFSNARVHGYRSGIAQNRFLEPTGEDGDTRHPGVHRGRDVPYCVPHEDALARDQASRAERGLDDVGSGL